MTTAENLGPLPLPLVDMWSSIGVVRGPELHGGYQSRVFAAHRNGEAVVVKLTDSRLIDQSFQRRLEVVAELADIDDSVVGPVAINTELATSLGGWLATVYPFAMGTSPDPRDEADVRSMALTLASLHRSLAKIRSIDLPPVATLAGINPPTDDSAFGRAQLLHGDFSSANMLFSDRGPQVFDFDDCGCGPIEFEVGNTLYMVLFDAVMSSEMALYEHFRDWFVDEYRSAVGDEVPDHLVDKSIRLRVEALGRWVDHPASAPIGIRTATPEWRRSLREFVRSQTGPDA